MKIRYDRVPTHQDEIYGMLVSQLFGTLGALIAAVAGSIALASAGVFLDGRPQFAVCLAALVLASIFRAAVLIAFKRNGQNSTDRESVRQWEIAYAAAALLWMLVIGIDTYFSMTAPSMTLRIYASVTAMGITGGIAVRNASRPWIVVGQALAVLLPYALALLEIGHPAYLALLAMTVFMFVGVLSTTHTFNGLLLSAMSNAQRYTVLANRFDTALSNMSHGLIMFDSQRKVELVNDRFRELFDIPQDHILQGSTLREVVEVASGTGLNAPEAVGQYMEHIEPHLLALRPNNVSFRTHLDRVFDLRFHPTTEGGTVIVVENITEQRNAAEQIERMARYDELTGLPNRAMIKDALVTNLSNMDIEGFRPFSVLYLDVDNFKHVNDTLGHSTGDALLRVIAARISNTLRQGDFFARLAGDEFVILQYAADPVAVNQLATRLIQVVSAPYVIDEHELMIGLSIGIARAPVDGQTADDLLKNADLALYRAKQQGKGAFSFYEEGMNVDAQERREKELDLRHAIDNQDIFVHFQPIVDASTGRVACCEALVRWQHPTRGTVFPDQFIKLAETTGLIVDIGAIVLHKACVQALDWPSSVSVAVNLSAEQFRRGVVVDQIKSALERSGLPATRLEVEITETLLFSNLVATRQVIEEIQALGVKVALDDFGTGYSSLAYLHQIPFDKVKIDRSFVRDLETNGLASSLIRLMASFARILDKVLVVEGVETVEQLDALRTLGVRQIQGYYFSKPKAASELSFSFDVPEDVGSALEGVA